MSCISLESVQRKLKSSKVGVAKTEAAHILPFSLMTVDSNKKVFNYISVIEYIFYTVQLFQKASIWAVIKSFTNIEFSELNGDNINSLTNVITLDSNIQAFFGSLKLWFEAVPVCRVLLSDIDVS